MKLELIPKWVWLVLLAAVLGGAYFGIGYAVDTYRQMTTELSEEKAKVANLLEINASVNQELIRRIKDDEDRKKTEEAIDQQTTDLLGSVDELGAKLAKAVAERKKLEKQLANQSDGSKPPAFEGIPVEIDITWQAYCKVAITDPRCAPKEK
jgi:vacuolar-type H+-ATPase subunit I/STV1